MRSPFRQRSLLLLTSLSMALAACGGDVGARSAATRIGAPDALTRGAAALTLDDGDTVVVGSTTGTVDPDGRRGSVDGLVVRVGGAGGIRWARQLGGPGAPVGLVVKAWDVALGSSDDVIVAGLVNGAPSIEGQALPAVYTGFVASFARGDGSLRWLRLLGDASGPTELMGVEVLSDGVIVAAGYTAAATLYGATTLGAGDVLLAWLAPGGDVLDVRRYGGADEEYPTAFVAREDRLYLTRHAVDGVLGQALALELVALDRNGSVSSSVEVDEPASTEISALSAHPLGVCAALQLRTFSESAGAGMDYALRCFDPELVVVGEARHGRPGESALASGLVCHEDGRCTLVGTADGAFEGEALGLARVAFVSQHGPTFERERVFRFGPSEIDEEHFARGVAVAGGRNEPRIVADVAGTLFGDTVGRIDVVVAPFELARSAGFE